MSALIRSVRLWSLLSMVTLPIVLGCRATVESAPADAAVAPTATLDPVWNLDKTEEQALYLKMLGVELEAGLEVAKDQLHSTRGVLECRKDGPLASCQLRVRLRERELSNSQPLSPELTKQAWDFIAAARPELRDERLVLADLVCDYIGKKSPPFDVEDVDCRVSQARLVSEAVFDQVVAEELAEAIRGDISFGNEVVTLNGAISCRIVEGSQRATCVVRTLTTGVLADKVIELSPRGANSVARRLLQAALDHSLLTTPADASKTGKSPTELMATLVCLVDSTEHERSDTRQFLCRAGL